MSKVTKLLKNSKLFFSDAIKKRKAPAAQKPVPKKPVPKKPVPKKPVPLFEAYQLNSFYPYKILLHTGEGKNGITHMNLWIPIFKQSEVDFVVMVRNYEVFKYLKEKYTELPLVFAKEVKEVDSVLNKMHSLRACFYPSNTGNNIHTLKYNNIEHIFIGHGDSDKTASAHKYFRVYDENWVANQAHIDRFNNAGFDHTGLKHIKVGRPNLKETLLLTQEDWKSRYEGKINLLYLSTWEGIYVEQEYTSIEIIKEFFENINTLIPSVNINIKLHPWLGRRRRELVNYENVILKSWEEKAEDSSKFSLKIHTKDTPVEELIKLSNVFICDISAVISEALAGNGPIFVYIPKDKPIKTLKSKMDYSDYTYVFSSIDELREKFNEVIVKGNDYLANKRVEAMEYILGKKATLEDTFIQNLQKIEEGVAYDL